jgi:S-adenosylmethionine hydrolase
MTRPIITLTTDFGLKDPYVAEMKAVILSICRDAAIVDVSHQGEKFNIRMGAYILASAAPYFPAGTIHVAIVDPAVGTKRRALCIETKNGFFIGPDNGVLILAAKAQGISHVYEIKNRKFMLPNVSNTFQGRDVFSPAAANLANGIHTSDLGPEVRNLIIPAFAKVAKGRYRVEGEVVHVDDFGNVMTNIGASDLESINREKTVKLRVGKSGLMADFCKTYAEVEPKKPMVLIGSHGFFEISVNQGNAAKMLKVRVGDKVTVYPS